MSGVILVTPESHPALFSTLTTLSYAMGAVNRHEPERAAFYVPDRFGPDLDGIDARLEHLTEDEIDTFTDGEQAESEEIAGRSPALTRAHELLNAMFDGDGSI